MGYFWRVQGSTSLPPPLNFRAREVEMLSLDTVKVLSSFKSGVEAAKPLGMSSSRNIYDALKRKKEIV